MPVDPDDPTAGDPAADDALRRVAAIGRPVDSDVAAEDPPPDLWPRITSEAFPGEASAGDASAGAVVELASHRRRRRVLLGAVAAALVVIVGIGTLVASNRSTSRNELVASTNLSLIAGEGKGTAELVKEDGTLHLRVDVSGLAPAEKSDFYELWLIAPDFADMKSMATFDRSTDTLDIPVPKGMDPAKFPLVDISEEVNDNNPGHSGRSILRGSLA